MLGVVAFGDDQVDAALRPLHGTGFEFGEIVSGH